MVALLLLQALQLRWQASAALRLAAPAPLQVSPAVSASAHFRLLLLSSEITISSSVKLHTLFGCWGTLAICLR